MQKKDDLSCRSQKKRNGTGDAEIMFLMLEQIQLMRAQSGMG